MFQNHDLILFDLDGTISDPVQGIGRSINYALDHYGYKPLALSDLTQYIGPPIHEVFQTITGNTADCPALVAKYRERYGDIGYAENVLYPGIPEVLSHLHAAHLPIALCTSKRQDFAERILEMFELSHYFRFINGGEVGIPKFQQIESLLAQGQVSQSTLMIGDRAVDLIAAHKNGLKSGGVLWGYGSKDELLAEDPLYLFRSPSELIQLAQG